MTQQQPKNFEAMTMQFTAETAGRLMMIEAALQALVAESRKAGHIRGYLRELLQGIEVKIDDAPHAQDGVLIGATQAARAIIGREKPRS